MSDCRPTNVGVAVQVAARAGVDVAALLRRYGVGPNDFSEAGPRLPWALFADALTSAEQVLGLGALEMLGVETIREFRLFRQLASLYFDLSELYYLVGNTLITLIYGEAVQADYASGSDGSIVITLTLNAKYATCTTFWSLTLGQLRGLPRHLNATDAAIEAEIGERFAVFTIRGQRLSPDEQDARGAIRDRVRQLLLRELLAVDDTGSSETLATASALFQSHSAGAPSGTRVIALAPPSQELATVRVLLARISRELGATQVSLWRAGEQGFELSGSLGAPLMGARVRRLLDWEGQSLGWVEVAREPEQGSSAVALRLDKRCLSYAQEFAQICASGVEQSCPDSGTQLTGSVAPAGSVAQRVRELTTRWELTARQASVLALIAEGLSNKEIATRLQCSVGTIENHLTRLFRRASVDNRAALAASFWRTGT